MTPHKYLYVHANPVTNIDPSGHMLTVAETTYVVAMVGAVSAWHVYNVTHLGEEWSFRESFIWTGWGAMLFGLGTLWALPAAILPGSEALLERAESEVALDANSLITGLDYGQIKTLDRALAGRKPVVPIQAAVEYVNGKNGEPARLMRFLRDRGGRISRAGCEYLASALRELAPKVPVASTGTRKLHIPDSRVVATAVAENLPLITNDKPVFNLLQAANEAGMSQFPKGEPLF